MHPYLWNSPYLCFVITKYSHCLTWNKVPTSLFCHENSSMGTKCFQQSQCWSKIIPGNLWYLLTLNLLLHIILCSMESWVGSAMSWGKRTVSIWHWTLSTGREGNHNTCWENQLDMVKDVTHLHTNCIPKWGVCTYIYNIYIATQAEIHAWLDASR